MPIRPKGHHDKFKLMSKIYKLSPSLFSNRTFTCNIKQLDHSFYKTMFMVKYKFQEPNEGTPTQAT